MKKITLTLLSFTLAFSMFAGGLVTNSNHSAAWTRMLNRNATVDIDAVYFNPAALTKLSDGFHISISNQIIGQTKTITNSALNGGNGKSYQGDVFAPVYPAVSVAYKTGKLAFSFGFYPIGGGGSAEFKDGLPSFELPVAGAATGLALTGVTGYAMDTYLKGSSIYFGFQGGVSYEINDMISIYAGARYVMAKNTYEGTITDIQFNTASGLVPAGDYMNGVAAQLTDLSNAHLLMAAAVNAGYGGITFDQAEAAGLITAEQKTGLEAGLVMAGYTGDVSTITAAEAQPIFEAASPKFASDAAEMSAGAAQMGDKKLETEQTGSGVTPIVGVNLSLMDERLNIGLKYEFQTNMELTNSTTVDDTGLFPDGEVTNADMPASLTGGVSFKATDALRIEGDFETYFDKNVGWERTDPFTGDKISADKFIGSGYLSYGLGIEYTISEALLASVGWSGSQTGVNDNYHSDLSYSLNTNTFGAGAAYKINDMITVNLGGYYVMYQDKTVTYPVSTTENYTQTYGTSLWGVGIGLDFSF